MNRREALRTMGAAEVFSCTATDARDAVHLLRYRAAKQAGLAVRIVFSSAEDEQAPLRGMLLAHIDQEVLGPDFVDPDIATEPDTGHFDLLDVAVIERHLVEVFDGVRIASV